jgi:hypothetical protein
MRLGKGCVSFQLNLRLVISNVAEQSGLGNLSTSVGYWLHSCTFRKAVPLESVKSFLGLQDFAGFAVQRDVSLVTHHGLP